MLLTIKNFMNDTCYRHTVIDVGQIEIDYVGMKVAYVL